MYSGSIQQLDPENQQVLVQYRRWSKRYQEWFHWDSPHIRGLDRVSLRKQGLECSDQKPLYSAGSKVMACWTDCKFYPAKVLQVNKDDSYTVRFFDGVIRTVRPLKIKPYDENWKKDNSSEEWDSDSEVDNDGGLEQGEEAKEDIKEDIKEEIKEDTDDVENKDAEEKGIKEDTDDKDLRDEEGKSDLELRHVIEENKKDTLKTDIDQEKKEGNVDDNKDPCVCDITTNKVGGIDGKGKEVGDRQRKRRADILREARAKRKRIGKRKSAQVSTPTDRDQTIKEDNIQVNREILLERQAHLPTTHKFSREPLYRVIKRQPPPILSIELDHNEFKCPAPNCSKSFRKSSLLHCHLKYYHTSAVQSPAVSTVRERKKPLSSEGVSDTSDVKPEVSIFRHEDEDPVAVETDQKIDPNRPMRKERSRDRKHFLRVKLKKKKKKKKRSRRHAVFCSSEDEGLDPPSTLIDLETHRPDPSPHRRAGAEEGSDWSTLTAESGEDTVPWPVSAETESDVVRCVCEVDEENDFMIQCSQCRCWQHGTCLGLLEHHLPQSYTCLTCRCSVVAPDWSRTRRRACSDWLMSGHMFGLSCVGENFSEQNSEQIALTRRLLAHTRTIATVTATIGLKLRLLQSGSEAELRFWRLPWRRDEGEGPKVVCYVSSEHCYQKPTLTQVSPEEMEAEPEENLRPPKSSDTCRTPQLNLLDHIETLQQEVSRRLERMESELDGLESWMDELESADPLSHLPDLKQRIRRLLRDLSTVRQLSVCS